MEVNVYRNLMRVFFQYQTDTLLCVRDKIVIGTIDKRGIEELMSDLSHVKTAQEIPVNKITTQEQTLEALLYRGIMVNDQKIIPVVDNKGNFVALWSKTEILTTTLQFANLATPGFDKTRETSHAQKEAFNAEQNLTPEGRFAKEFIKENFKAAVVAPVKPEVRFKISSSLENNVRSQAEKHSESKNINHHDSDYVSIKTLEALPIPMLAVDTKGEVLFYNQDWVSLQQQNKEILGVKKLMNVSRDIMAKMAFDGDLEIDSILKLPNAPGGYSLQMKSIQGDHETPVRVIGYIFWAEHRYSENPDLPKTGAAKIASENALPVETKIDENLKTFEHRQSYTGKTLIELLEIEEKKIIRWAMDETGHNQSNAAMLLGIPRQTFSYRYHKLFDEKPSGKSSTKSAKRKK
jgi:DNA-binding protein Fis